MSESFEVLDVVPATPKQVFDSWLDGEAHAGMTGSMATGRPTKGARFTAWDGYITGRNLELEPYRRIVQSWRTTEFPSGSADSRLEILLEEAPGGARVILRHTGMPAGQAESYRQGWRDFYFQPMKEYFAGQA